MTREYHVRIQYPQGTPHHTVYQGFDTNLCSRPPALALVGTPDGVRFFALDDPGDTAGLEAYIERFSYGCPILGVYSLAPQPPPQRIPASPQVSLDKPTPNAPDRSGTHEGEWGSLPGEPCRYCRAVGGVQFLVDEGPEGRVGMSPVRCIKCGRDWVPGESSA